MTRSITGFPKHVRSLNTWVGANRVPSAWHTACFVLLLAVSARYSSSDHSSAKGEQKPPDVVRGMALSNSNGQDRKPPREVCDKGKPGESRRRKATRLIHAQACYASRAADSHYLGGRDCMRTAFLAVAGLAYGATACSSSQTSVEVQRTPVAAVSVTLPSPSLIAGQTQRAIAVPTDASGAPLANRPIVWETSNPVIAAVSDSGMISAAAPGTAVISATSEGIRGQASLSVVPVPPIPVATVSVALGSSSVVAGQTTTAVATLRDAGGNALSGRAIIWSSSNSVIASVSSAGLVSAKSAGSANIIASSEGKSGLASLTVTAVSPPPPVPVASVTVTPSTANLQVGATLQLTAVTRDANNNVLTGRAVTWTSSSAGTATVSSSGLASAVAAGSTTITATSGGASGTSALTVATTPPPPPPPGPAPVIFSDDFESGSLSKWDEFNTTTQAVINNPSLAHSGSSFMRMTYGINGGDGGWMNKYFTQGFTRLYVRLWVRFSTSFGGGTKLVSLRGSRIGQPTLGVGRAGICPTGKDAFSANLVTEFTGADAYPTKMYTYWQDMWADPNGQCWGRYGPTNATWTSPYVTPMPMISKGTWHLVEFAVKMNSSANVADGEQKFWIDGVKYGEWTGIRWGDPAFVNLGVLQINGSSTLTQTQTLDIDDLVLIYDYPTP
jgi:uncharacterized protein YjdB